jgi:protein-tyrosine phosphatase
MSKHDKLSADKFKQAKHMFIAKKGKKKRISFATDIPRSLFRKDCGGRVPDGWKELEFAGNIVPNTKFIPIKAPLSPYGFQTPFNFDLKKFVQHQKELGIEIGLLVDLTNTDRYYNVLDLPHGLQYFKLRTKGHDEAPAEQECESFNSCVNDFLQRQPDKHIIVHCTHGLNRTGFMIVNWICKHTNTQVDDGITSFNTARYPGMYSPILLDALYERNNATHSEKYQKMDYGEIPYWSVNKLTNLAKELKLREKPQRSGTQSIAVTDVNTYKSIADFTYKPKEHKKSAIVEHTRKHTKFDFTLQNQVSKKRKAEEHSDEPPSKQPRVVNAKEATKQAKKEKKQRKKEERAERAAQVALLKPKKNKDKYDKEKRKLLKKRKR